MAIPDRGFRQIRLGAIAIATLSAFLLATSQPTLAQRQGQPQRFLPPVHAKPLAQQPQPPRPLRQSRVQQVGAWQELSDVHLQAPASNNDSAGRWRGRSSNDTVGFRQSPRDSTVVQPEFQSDTGQTGGFPNDSGWTLSDGQSPEPPPQLDSLSLPIAGPSATSNYQGNSLSAPSPGAAEDERATNYRETATFEQVPAGSIGQPSSQDQIADPPGTSVLVDSEYSSHNTEDNVNRLRIEPQRSYQNDMRAPRGATPAAYRRPTAAPNYYGRQESVNPGGAAQENFGRGLKSCEEFRAELLDDPITNIVLDTSPVKPAPEAQEIPEGLTRTWKDCFGNVLGSGTLVGLRRSDIVISNEQGGQNYISMSRLSDDDLSVVTQFWDLPNECTLGCYRPEERQWHPNTVTWTASSLCHNPLYFENVQLERYGHSNGPILEPIRSTAHFFVSLISIPYQAGIHPPNECVYALGYYRPGNCAPWLREPIPLSLAGTAKQAAFMVGAYAILP